MKTYIGLIHKDPKSDFGVSFPDLPGCVSAGRTLDEAYRMAEEALALHIEGMADEGLAVPEPSSLEQIMADPVNRDGVAVVVPAPAVVRTVRVNITLSDQLLAQIDREADARGITRSGFLAEAARAALVRPEDLEQAMLKIFGNAIATDAADYATESAIFSAKTLVDATRGTTIFKHSEFPVNVKNTYVPTFEPGHLFIERRLPPPPVPTKPKSARRK
jgi:predicted RNase H-like HicB family nuclease